MNCFPFRHRLHLNVSCVSHFVDSLYLNKVLRSSREKCLSTSSAYISTLHDGYTLSTTQDESDCLWDCRWKIFSSIVPVAMNRYTKQSFFWPSRHTLASACWSAAGFQSYLSRVIRGLPGSNRMRRFAPMRFKPQPPAFELNKKTNSAPSGSLKRSTSFCRLFTFMVPSSRRQPYLH